MAKISVRAVGTSTVPALLVYLLVNSAIESLLYAATGLSVVHGLEQKTPIPFGTSFHVINGVLFSCEMFLVMYFYALIRPMCASGLQSRIVTILFFFFFTALFLAQMINLRIYPMNLGVIFLIATAVAFPISVYTGCSVYDRIYHEHE